MRINVVLSPTNLTYTFPSALQNKIKIAIRKIVISSNTFTDPYQLYFIRCNQLSLHNNYDPKGFPSDILDVFAVGSATSNITYIDSLDYMSLVEDSISKLEFRITDSNNQTITLTNNLVLILD